MTQSDRQKIKTVKVWPVLFVAPLKIRKLVPNSRDSDTLIFDHYAPQISESSKLSRSDIRLNSLPFIVRNAVFETKRRNDLIEVKSHFYSPFLVQRSTQPDIKK